MKTDSSATNPNVPLDEVATQSVHLVALGASAGGLEAIHEFFDNVPDGIDLSFVVIQHLSPDYKSMLVELVAKHTNMRVVEAREAMLLEKNTVYVIPVKKHLTVKSGKLRLTEKGLDKGPNTAIDTFFLSMAADKGAKSIAVILSGTGTDGSRGVEAVKKAGGLVFAQDPVTAKFDGMPNSAVATGAVDFILAPELMPEQIFKHIHQVAPAEENANGAIDEGMLEEIFKLVYKSSGCDFHAYKRPTIIRRIAKRMSQGSFRNLNDYIERLRRDSEECKELCKEFLIGVTKFFRDKPAFDILSNEVLPYLIRKKADGDTLKIWVTACSTGEEVYSIAMMLDQQLRQSGREFSVKIFATDIDNDALEVASKGIYPANALKDVEPSMIDRYFIRQGDRYLVVPEIRKQIVFAKHNIFKDPPFIKNDLVTCRNLLIYFNDSLQKKVINTLCFSLQAGGYLFLGPSESAANHKDELQEVNGKWKIYIKESNRKPGTVADGDSPRLKETKAYGSYVPTSLHRKAGRNLLEDLRDVIVEERKIAALYIDRNYEVKEATGDYRRYLTLPATNFQLNVLKMVAPDLALPLGNAIRMVVKEGKMKQMERVKIREGSRLRYVNATVKPLSGSQNFLIVLEETGDEEHPAEAGSSNNGFGGIEQNEYILELEAELKETKLNLQTVVEELETTNEELQSSNEELLSANEELQSSNEELQSLNEELHTLNAEHQLKIRELIEVNEDLDNYFRSTDIAQVFVDASLRVRKFNAAAVRQINLIESDIGRPLSHISTNLVGEDLQDDIEQVMQKGISIERDVALVGGPSYQMRVLPYIRQDGKANGAVITFYDVTTTKNLNSIINGVFNASRSAIIALQAVRNKEGAIVDFSWIAANDAADQMYGREHGQLQGKRLSDLHTGETSENELLLKYISVLESDRAERFEYAFRSQEGETWYEVVAVRMGDDGIAATFTDITDKRQSDERLRHNYNQLVLTREELRKLNTGLESTIEDRTKELSRSEERLRLISQATNDALWDWDFGANTVWWNEAFFAQFNYEEKDGTYPVSFWKDNIHPEDRDRVLQSIYGAINNGVKKWSDEYRFAKADGTYAQVLDRGYILHDENGIPYRMLGSMLDVTALRQAEEEINTLEAHTRYLADAMPNIVWTALPDGSFDFLNQRWYQVTGANDDAGEIHLWDFSHPADVPHLQSDWEKHIKEGHTFETELRLRWNNEWRWVLCTGRLVRDKEGQPARWYGTIVNIDEQRKAKQVLEQTVAQRTAALRSVNEELERSNHDLQQFASVASHDLKEPLRKIQMFGNLLLEKVKREGRAEYKDHLERITLSSSRMTQLIDDLLSFSRLSAEVKEERVDLDELVAAILGDLEILIQEKGAQIHLANLPTLYAVPGQMRQLFQNLIGNALKFSRPGVQPDVSIACEMVSSLSVDAPADADGSYAKITIRDNGIGFDEQYLDKIFTLFQRLHSKEAYEGTGIGLAICKKIVEKHDGIITAHSVQGEGATFYVVLPLRRTG